MKRIAIAFGLALAATCVSATASLVVTREWRFDVSLDGRPIGEHRYYLRERSDERQLTSEAQFRVRILFFDAYRYRHRAQETWRGDCLERLDAHTDANGEQTQVAGDVASGAFRMQTNGTATALEACVQTFAYWNPSILEARRLLNPQTGEYVEVRVEKLGRETIAGQTAERYRLFGGGSTPLEIDLWYSPQREWLALESLTPEGRRLRYARRAP